MTTTQDQKVKETPEIFENDLKGLMDYLSDFYQKHPRTNITVLLKHPADDTEVSKPKILVSGHYYDAAVIIAKAYNSIMSEIMEDLKVHY